MYEVKLSAAQIAALTGLNETQVGDKFADAIEPDELIAAIKDRVKFIRGEAVKEGTRKKGEALEKRLAPFLDKYGVDKAETVEETAENLLTAMATPDKTGGELTLEDLRKHPLAAQLVEAETLKIKQRFEADLAQNTARLQQIERERLWAKAKAEIVPHLDNAILGQATKEQAAEMLLQLIGIDNLGENESGNVIPVKDGKPLTDDVYNPVGLGDVVKKTWSLGFNQTDPTKNGGGAPAAGSTKAGSANPYKFTNLEEASKAIERETDLSKRALMREAQIALMQQG